MDKKMIIVVFIAGMAGMSILRRILRRAFIAFQLRELEYMWGLSSPKYIVCNPGKLGKRFKYLHNFVIETRMQFRSQLRNLKEYLLDLCLKHNILGFKSTPLGKCLQFSIDREEKIFHCRLKVPHKAFARDFRDYLHSLLHPDPLIYGDNVGKGKTSSGNVTGEDLAN